ncbi:DUF2637 domain-containing protein [Actinomadura hibisca]|uniref:DUF2637 domain-containing protein n=1 Tax=Actinomadura hibisca TaxID=68565 RepID=UPI00082E6B84|nr:DUF2637 domain-containing protein [Actinomadura hibisca]
MSTPHTPPPSFGNPDPNEPPAPPVRPLTGNEFTAAVTVAALVAVLALLGFVNSFAAVADAARPSFGRLAWTVPVGIDLGIAAFAALDIVLARLDMRVKWLRLVPWALTGATVYLNVAVEHTAFGRISHALLPVLWVIAVEIGAHVIRVRAGIASGTRMDGIRGSRWVLAPWPTLKLWRRMVLWEIRSYPDALGRERDRVLARTDLKDTYGALAWRWKAPRRTKALYRLGELTPATLPTGLPAGLSAEVAPATVTATPGDLGDTGPDTGPVTVTARPVPALTAGRADTTPDTTSGSAPDSAPVTVSGGVSAAGTGPRPATVTARTRPAKSATRPTAKTRGKTGAASDRLAARARKLLADHPEMTGAELGRRLKVSERTGSRLRNRLTTPTTTEHAPEHATQEGATS